MFLEINAFEVISDKSGVPIRVDEKRILVNPTSVISITPKKVFKPNPLRDRDCLEILVGDRAILTHEASTALRQRFVDLGVAISIAP